MLRHNITSGYITFESFCANCNCPVFGLGLYLSGLGLQVSVLGLGFGLEISGLDNNTGR